MNLATAMAITAEAFKDETDKASEPYFIHCIEVWNGVKHLSINTQIVAILHDLVEDTKWTLQDLRDMGFSDEVVFSVKILTHDKDISYEDYILEVAKFKIPRDVKKSDIKHNGDITRLKGVSAKDQARMTKYYNAYHYLKSRS